jgi:hypothetical protein
MNERQCFIAALTFGKPDQYPLDPGEPRESTLAAWRQQGLPEGVDWRTYLWQVLGLPPESKEPRCGLEVDLRMLPTFEEKVLEHRDGHYIVQDWMGAVTEISDRYDYTYIRSAKDFVTRKWHRFPVQTRQDWEEKIIWRYSLDQAGRFPVDFKARSHRLQGRDYPLRLDFNGPFWQVREWVGFEGLCLLLTEDPSFVQEMVTFWSDFVTGMLERILAQVQPDFVQVSEDMAYKIHSMISPAMTRRFLLPTWQRWGELIKASGCPIYAIDCDGYIGELIPLWIEAGFTYTWPVEAAAGNDIVAYRRQYGKQMAYGGAIDKRALAAGGEVMRAELRRVIPPLLEQGGFLPGCDHGVPPDVSWPDYVEYTRTLAQMLGWL